MQEDYWANNTYSSGSIEHSSPSISSNAIFDHTSTSSIDKLLKADLNNTYWSNKSISAKFDDSKYQPKKSTDFYAYMQLTLPEKPNTDVVSYSSQKGGALNYLFANR